MMNHDIFRLGAVSSLTVTSTATSSVALAGTQTRALRLVVPALTAASANAGVGVFYAIVTPVGAGAVTSAAGNFLPVGVIETVKTTPGTNTQVEARGIGATSQILYVTELTD